MQPVFDEYIQFLNHHGLNHYLDKNKIYINLKEGYFWKDKTIIKAYGKDGVLYKILRFYIDDNLKITFKHYGNEKKDIETWGETIKRNEERINNLTKESLTLITNSLDQYKEYIPLILTSGGKDSTVTMDLVRKVVDAKLIFGDTTLESVDTYRYIKQLNNVEKIRPEQGFYQWRKKENIVPTRLGRACCRCFKEEVLIDKLNRNSNYLFFMGMRNSESAHRKDYGDTWANRKWGDRNWIAILPIRKWTEEDVWLYLLKNNVDFNGKYKKGYNRVGCAIACPFYTKNTWILDKFWYPKMYQRWQNILKEDFINNEKWIRMNCTLDEYYICWNGGIYRPEPTEEVIKEFVNYKGINYEIAKKYFENKCKNCNKKIKNINEIAMNMKFFGRNISDMFCKKCFKKEMFIDDNQWNDYIKNFKQQGCELF